MGAGIGEIASAAGDTISTLWKLFAGKKQTKQNNADLEAVGTYKANPLAKEQLAMAQSLFNGRMAGAANAEQNILTNQAATVNNVENNATDASQALALMAATQGQADKSFSDLATQEAADRLQKAGLVAKAQDTNIAEGDKVWADIIRKLQQKIGIRSVGYQNTANAVQSLGNMAAMAGNMIGSKGG